MYRIEVQSLTLTEDLARNVEESERNVFLDVWSEGQMKRRFHMGRWAGPGVRGYTAIVHYSSSAVMMELSRGPLRRDHLGQQTLFEFLDEAGPEERRMQVPFGRGPLYELHVHISRVRRSYTLELLDVHCIAQVSSKLRRDPVFVEVEHNRSPHAVLAGPTSLYHLGDLAAHQSSGPNASCSLNSTDFSNALVTFFVRGYFSDHILGRLLVARRCEFPAAAQECMRTTRAALAQSTNDRPPSDRSTFSSSQSTPSASSLPSSSFSSSTPEANLEVVVALLPFSGLPEDIEPGHDLTYWALDVGSGAQQLELALQSAEGGSYVVRLAVHVQPYSLAVRVHGSHAPVAVIHPWQFDRVHRPSSDLPHAEPTAVWPDPPQDGDTTTTTTFSEPTTASAMDLLVDGESTFESIYGALMASQHSITILGWELSLAFEMIRATRARTYGTVPLHDKRRPFVSLEDVLVWKARRGVQVRVLVWRHEVIRQVARWMYLGSVSLEYELEQLRIRCEKEGVRCSIVHGAQGLHSPLANAYHSGDSADIVVVLAGNPRGLLSSHHEKLVVVDADCPDHAVAFMGGFDIARGRYDSCNHETASSLFESPANALLEASPSRILWHDVHCALQGAVVQTLQLHFVQRWAYAFSLDPGAARSLVHGTNRLGRCDRRHLSPKRTPMFGPGEALDVRLTRSWNGVVEGHLLFEEFAQILQGARRWLYIEHQYPFQNFSLTYYLCRALQRNPELHVVVVTPVKTDLPAGVVGEWIDWSQDQIIDHLALIHQAAPDRVAVYGLVQQDPRSRRIRPIYVHSKLIVADGETLLLSSANLDNMSFFYSSELCLRVRDSRVAERAWVLLMAEHLGAHWRDSMRSDFLAAFDALRVVAAKNDRAAEDGSLLVARPIALMPKSRHDFWLQRVYYPNKLSKLLLKLGVDSEDMWIKLRNRVWSQDPSANWPSVAKL